MALSPRLDLRQSQTLVMTPQLQQAIKMLQLNNLEIMAYVDEQLEINPLLERADNEEQPTDPADPADPEPRNDDPAAAETTAPEAAPVEALDSDYDNMWNGDSGVEVTPPVTMEVWRNAAGGTANAIDFAPQAAISLRDHLLNQLNVDLDDPIDRVIGVHLIDLLDDAGYIDGDIAMIAERLGCDEARVEATLGLLQGFDPIGVFARDLAECLTLQLREQDRLDPIMAKLIDNLDLLADHDYATLRRRCGADEEDFTDMLAEIKGLNPKPGLAFSSEVAQTLVPDVMVRKGGGGDWIIELNNETLPRVLVNERYYAIIAARANSKRDKEYISDCLSTANWLVKSLAQRATTILRVATELVRQQEGFLNHGVQHLRPLVLRNIAEAIDMHESTVSRVTANKYMITPRGIFEMRYFFTTAIASSHGGEAAHSSESVRHRIKALIDAEEAGANLSDDRLTAILRAEGIDIARRTIAKYREAMNIPSSMRRRRATAI
jgi:RNA polymerase sigma-54 factor